MNSSTVQVRSFTLGCIARSITVRTDWLTPSGRFFCRNVLTDMEKISYARTGSFPVNRKKSVAPRA